MEFEITGSVREKESNKPIPGLLVRCSDKDLFFDDILGSDITAADGSFSIGYNEKDFTELFEKKPDIYLKVYRRSNSQDPGLGEAKFIYSTEKTVRFRAGQHEFFLIEIPHHLLGSDAPSTGEDNAHEPGEWKGTMQFEITGVVRERGTNRPIPGLLVRGFDKDLLFDDALGSAITASDGSFWIGYNKSDFAGLFERHPDIFLKVYGSSTAQNPGLAGDEPIYSTEERVRFGAGNHAIFLIDIPYNQLGSDAPCDGTNTDPETDKWKGSIDNYLEKHPIKFIPDPTKGFMAPRLRIASNFISEDLTKVQIGDSAELTFTVINEGNGISFFSYVELYEGEEEICLLIHHRLCDHKIITINPGQRVDVTLNWNRKLKTGKVVGICFDPMLDPRGVDAITNDLEDAGACPLIKNPNHIALTRIS